MKTSYCIIKLIENKAGGKPIPCVIIDTHNEVMEFDTLQEADHMRDIFSKNSDSGHIYEVRKIGGGK